MKIPLQFWGGGTPAEYSRQNIYGNKNTAAFLEFDGTSFTLIKDIFEDLLSMNAVSLCMLERDLVVFH